MAKVHTIIIDPRRIKQTLLSRRMHVMMTKAHKSYKSGNRCTRRCRRASNKPLSFVTDVVIEELDISTFYTPDNYTKSIE